jgi:thiamine-monophosphate kinase
MDSALPRSEKNLIADIRRMARRGPGVVAGIGDDCAVLQVSQGHETLVTTDFTLEGIHFRREWHPPEAVGHRCLARGLSDIAAMGGVPIASFLSLALPRDLPQSWVDRFMKGLLALAGKFHITLAGGDTAQSPDGILADIIVIGSVPKGKAVLRSRAKPGDRIFVSGELGGSAGTLHRLIKAPARKLKPQDFPRHFFPEPRLGVGQWLREKGVATAMIDTSDGLSTDLSHICEESGVGAEVWEGAIPLGWVGRRQVDVSEALHGGEDYELLFTVPAGRRVPMRIAGVPVTQIGVIQRGKKMVLKSGAGKRTFKPQGWEHFRG